MIRGLICRLVLYNATDLGAVVTNAWLSIAEEIGDTRGKRKRKPSEKAMELQAEKAKPLKGSGRTVKAKTRVGVDQEIDDSVNGDEDDDDASY